MARISDRTFGLTGISRGWPAAATSDPSGRVESVLRGLAQAVIDDTPADVLEESGLFTDRKALREWALDIESEHWPGRVVDMIEAERPSAEDDLDDRERAQAHYDRLGRIATLLVWADDLAGDYIEPRIERWRQASDG